MTSMRSHQITFHGDLHDLSLLFVEWFGGGQLFVAETLGRLNEGLVTGRTADFALAQLLVPGDQASEVWVIGPSSKTLVLDDVRMADGSGAKQKAHLSNRWVVGIRFGGQTSERELQPSVLSASGDNEEANALYARLRKSVTSRASRADSCWLLPGAYDKLMAGWRLTRGQFHAPFTDLRPEEAEPPRKLKPRRDA